MDRLGALPVASDRVEFRVWAPNADSVAVRLATGDHPLERTGPDTWQRDLAARAGDDYWLVVDGTAWPDPCSRFQPEGVRGPSRVVDTSARSRPRARSTRSSRDCGDCVSSASPRSS